MSSQTRARKEDDYSDLVPWFARPWDFDRKALMGVGRYHPLPIELETLPRDNRAECTTNDAVTVIVRPKAKGRTGARPSYTYTSLNQAMRMHGRWVRTAIETGKPTPQGTAKRITGVWYAPSTKTRKTRARSPNP